MTPRRPPPAQGSTHHAPSDAPWDGETDRRTTPDRRTVRDRRQLLQRLAAGRRAAGGRRRTDPQRHGTRACYQAGCDCLPCKAANARYAQRRRRTPLPRVPAWKLRRVLRELLGDGYTKQDLDSVIGGKGNLARFWRLTTVNYETWQVFAALQQGAGEAAVDRLTPAQRAAVADILHRLGKGDPSQVTKSDEVE